MNISILKMVVVIIGLILFVVAVGSVFMVVSDKAIPGTFETVLVAGMMGLLGLLAPSKEVT